MGKEKDREEVGGSGRVKRKGTVTIAIIPQRFLEVGEVPPLVSACNGTHAFYGPHIRVILMVRRELTSSGC